MENILFKSYIESRAQEFDVNPNLLTHCFTGIIMSKSEYEVLKNYIHYMADELHKGAIEKKNSKNAIKRGTAEHLLETVDVSTIVQINDPGYEFLAIGRYFDITQTLKRFQLIAYLNAIEDIKKILDHKTVTRPLLGQGFLLTIQTLFTDDIEKFKEFARLFENPIKPN